MTTVTTTTGWSKIKFAIGDNLISGILGISYGTKVEMENQYGAGNKPLFIGEGNESYEGSMDLYRYEVDRMLDAITDGPKEISRIAATPITVTTEQPDGSFKTDIVTARFPEFKRDIKQNDKMDKITLPLHVVGIKYNV